MPTPDASVMTTSRLLRLGYTRTDLDRALRDGRLTRIRRGWWAPPDADTSLVTAVRAGGRLSCISLLALRGVWSPNDSRVHVRVARGATVRASPGVVPHWTKEPLVREIALDDAMDAMACAVGCLDLRNLVAAADSAANTRLIDVPAMELMLSATARGRRVLALWDPQAESGLETYVRLALRSARFPVRSQVVIDGIGRVDLLVGDRLVIELDGAAWHGGIADFERDRARDRALIARGYVVMRATYRQVMFELPVIVEQVRTLVRRREHRWRASQTGL
jgi:very-short-patch-repair endonuclease